MDAILFWVAEKYADGTSAARIKRTCRSCDNTITERILCLALARTVHNFCLSLRPTFDHDRLYNVGGLAYLFEHIRKEVCGDRQLSKVFCIVDDTRQAIDGDIPENDGWNYGLGKLLGVAAEYGYREVVEAVLQRGVRHGTVEALSDAAKSGHLDIALRLLEFLKSQPQDESDPKDFVKVGLGAGAGAGHEHVVRAFLEYKPGPEAVGHALVEAAKEGQEKMARLLLEVCSNHILNAEEWVDEVPTIIRESGLTLRDRFGDRPTVVTGSTTRALVVAASGGHTKVVDLLLDHVSLNINDRRPLLAASNKGYVEIVKLLLEKRDNMTVHVRQALVVAGNREVAEVLRERLRLEGV
ncbi:hypothetical protein HK104_002390 [Borealophlyctis nickersoniae]|nr:hypothetical protein HK104_002390 [Borealophlyctis nickersoniae]